MIRFIALFVTISLLGALPGLAQTPATPQTVRIVEVQGFKHLPAAVQEQITQAVKTQVGQPFNAEVADKDVEAMLHSGWFFNAWHSETPVDDGVRVVFNVMENPLVAGITFSGNTILSENELKQAVKSQAGQVLNQELVSSDAARLRQAYAAKGYTLVQIVDLKMSDQNELKFQIFEPRIGEVRIESDKKKLKTRDYVIRRELLFKAGDVYNEFDIHNSLRALDKLGIFQEVKAIPEPGTEPGTLLLTVQVVERRTGLAAVGLGHSNIKGLIGFLDVADTNLFGTGQKLNFRIQYGADDSYQISYTNPWIFKKRTSMSVNLYDRTILRQAVQGDETLLYNEDRSGFNVTLGRPLSPDQNTRGFVTLRNDRVRADLDEGTTASESLSGLLEPSDIRSLALSLVRDTRDNFLNPTAGQYSSAAVEVAGLGGAKFNKVTAEHRRYWALSKPPKPGTEAAAKRKTPIILASRLTVGTTTGTPPFLDQFLVGGADTLRGYKEDRFPGMNQVLMNNELRVPINDSLQVVGFVDLGDAWSGRFANSFGDPGFKLHAGYGAGVRVVTPIGPLRLDYALNDEGGKEFHFGIGSTF